MQSRMLVSHVDSGPLTSVSILKAFHDFRDEDTIRIPIIKAKQGNKAFMTYAQSVPCMVNLSSHQQSGFLCQITHPGNDRALLLDIDKAARRNQDPVNDTNWPAHCPFTCMSGPPMYACLACLLYLAMWHPHGCPFFMPPPSPNYLHAGSMRLAYLHAGNRSRSLPPSP